MPSAVWIGLVAAFRPGTSAGPTCCCSTACSARGPGPSPRGATGSSRRSSTTLLALTLVMALPLVDRAERRWSFWLPMVLAGLGLLTRYEVVTVMRGDVIHRANVVFWLFALGWATVKATAPLAPRAGLGVRAGDPSPASSTTPPATPWSWPACSRWCGSVPGAGPGLVRPCGGGVLASASLYIYLAHWQIYPHLEDRFPLARHGPRPARRDRALAGGRARDGPAGAVPGPRPGLLRLRAGAVRRTARRRTPGPIEPVPNRVTG